MRPESWSCEQGGPSSVQSLTGLCRADDADAVDERDAVGHRVEVDLDHVVTGVGSRAVVAALADLAFAHALPVTVPVVLVRAELELLAQVAEALVLTVLAEQRIDTRPVGVATDGIDVIREVRCVARYSPVRVMVSAAGS